MLLIHIPYIPKLPTFSNPKHSQLQLRVLAKLQENPTKNRSMASLPGTPISAPVLRPSKSMPVEGPKVSMEPAVPRMPPDTWALEKKGRMQNVKKMMFWCLIIFFSQTFFFVRRGMAHFPSEDDLRWTQLGSEGFLLVGEKAKATAIMNL